MRKATFRICFAQRMQSYVKDSASKEKASSGSSMDAGFALSAAPAEKLIDKKKVITATKFTTVLIFPIPNTSK
jgi:hypothetical protein